MRTEFSHPKGNNTMSKRRRKKIPQEPVTATIESLSHEGRGITHINSKTTFVFNGLPGETVEFRYTRCSGSHDEGQAINISHPSTERVDPACVHYGMCGGCSLQHLNHSSQIELKQKTFLELLQHQANTQPQNILPPIIANPLGYRRKARIGVKLVPGKNKVLVGFRERDKRFVANLNQCEVLHPHVGKKIDAFSQFIMQLDARDTIPQLEIAVADDHTALIVRHLEELSATDLQQLKQFAIDHDFYLYLQPKGLNSIHLFHPDNADPLLTYYLPKQELQFKFHPTQFTQVNHDINQLMVQQALDLLDLQKTDTVLDLFCGIGNFTLAVAKHCNQVVGIEGDDGSVNQARINATLNNITNTEFFTADLFIPVSDAPWAKSRYNKIILDPPRAGAIDILNMIDQWQPEKIVYISCNPATLARDTRVLVEKGYTLKNGGIMDMFPHTKHVEAMCLFERS